MIKAELRRGDGLNSGRIWLESVVRNAQLGLVDAGFLSTADGKFGGGTEKQLKLFQAAAGIEGKPGVVDRKTWKALQPNLDNTVSKTEAKYREYLTAFRGDPSWIHAREGHLGKPYWPGGASGVTLDPGVDLGHVSWETVTALFADILSKRELSLLKKVQGITGTDARSAMNMVPGLLDIRIKREQANAVFPFAVKPYWDRISKRMTGLRRSDTPASVQTILMSLAYNRGALNKHLQPLESLIANRQWQQVANTVSKMQQNHELKGIRIRRRHEGSLVRAELDFRRGHD